MSKLAHLLFVDTQRFTEVSYVQWQTLGIFRFWNNVPLHINIISIEGWFFVAISVLDK